MLEIVVTVAAVRRTTLKKIKPLGEVYSEAPETVRGKGGAG